MIKAGIIGVSGYAGIELFRILTSHPQVEIQGVVSQSSPGKPLGHLYPHLSHLDLCCWDQGPDELAAQCDCLFTAVPHGGSSWPYVKLAREQGIKIIDLSADFRLKDQRQFEEWYHCAHPLPALLDEAVYGLPELYRKSIRGSWLVANPGCYATAAILASRPLVARGLIRPDSLIVDAKSGVSGAGRKPKAQLHFPELDENFGAYAVAEHRHTPEIEQALSLPGKEKVVLTFTPHLVPMVRGILAVSYSTLKKTASGEELLAVFKEHYQDEPFVRVLDPDLPATKRVAGSNYVDIGLKVDKRSGRVIVLSALDNLVKGAGGQAVQNMNLMFGLDERMGLDFLPLYP